MIALDYFLYDNRSWSPAIGRDWGLKAATGVLAGRSDLRTAFVRYCTSLASEQGALRGFGEAVGGIRSRTESGYLLCITLETTDSFRRPSWATYGLWCPDPGTLDGVLRLDPIAAVKAALRADVSPASMHVRRTAASALTARSRHLSDARPLQRFEKGSTAGEVISLLLGMGAGAPDILGITANAHLGALTQSYQRVYCHPMDERVEQQFERLRVAPKPHNAKAQALLPRARKRIVRIALYASLPMLAAVLASGVLILRKTVRASSAPVHRDVIALSTLCAQFDELNALDRISLDRMSPPFLSTIAQRQKQMAGNRDIADYCNADSLLATRVKLDKLRTIAEGRDHAMDVNACKQIRSARDPSIPSAAIQWCEVFEQLDVAPSARAPSPSPPARPRNAFPTERKPS